MKKILSIANTVLLLLFRSGAGWGMIGLSVVLSVFMFFATASDNLLVNELHLRIKYSLYAFTVLLNVALIYFSCVTLRKDIDDRRFHTIAAAPVHRGQIWLGKFLGILSFGLIVFIASSVAIAISCGVFIMRWDDKDELSELKEKFFRTYYVCKPDLSRLDEEVEKEYEIRRKELEKKQALEEKTGVHIHDGLCSKHGCDKNVEEEPGHEHHAGCGHNHDELEGAKWRSRKYLLDEVRRDKQVIAPDSQGTWDFNLNRKNVKGDYILLRFKFYSNDRRKKIKGKWSVAGNDWSYESSSYPFLENEVRIPVDIINKSGSMRLIYTPVGSSYVIFPVYRDGLSLLYDSGGLLKNYSLLLFFSMLHMATLTALAMTFSSLFSYPVAVFVTTATYITGAFSQFFVNVLNDLAFHDMTFVNIVFMKILEFGIWVTEGTQAFPVNEMFSEGVSIPFASILKTDFMSYFIYLVIVVMIGVIALTRKEIDKLMQN